MGGGGDHVGEGDRVRVEAGGDQPGDVGHVDEQQRADLVGDGAEAREVEGLGVGGEAGDDHLRLMLHGQALDFVVVDQPGSGVQAVLHGVVLSANYDLSYQGNNLTITKALLNVIADAKTKVYGDADPSLTYQVSGLKNGDTAGAVLNGGSLSRVAGENVGVYGINQGDLALNSGNYDLSYQGNNLTITKALLNVIADAKTKVYGDADPAGRPFSESRLRGHRRDARVASVSGDDPRLIPGHAFALEGHPRADFNAWWRPVRVVHRGTQYAGQEEESADAPLGVSYDLRAELVPEDVEWRPAPLPRPRIDGPQIATVVGPAGEEIHCDEWGRVNPNGATTSSRSSTSRSSRARAGRRSPTISATSSAARKGWIRRARRAPC